MSKLEDKIANNLIKEIRQTKLECSSTDCEFHDLNVGSRTEFSCSLKVMWIHEGKCQKYKIKEEKKDDQK